MQMIDKTLTLKGINFFAICIQTTYLTAPRRAAKAELYPTTASGDDLRFSNPSKQTSMAGVK